MTRILALVVLLSGADIARAQDARPPDGEIPTAEVRLDGAALFRVRGVSSYPAEARAGLIRDRIAAAAADHTVSLDAVQTTERHGVSLIVAGDQPLLTVTDGDAALEDVSRQALATAHLLRIRQAIADYRHARSPAALARSAWRTVAATLALSVLIGALVWFWGRVDAVLTRRVQSRIHTVGIQSFEVVRAERIRGALRTGFRALRALVFVAGVLLYVGFVLRQWPWTKELSHGIADLALSPLTAIGAAVVANIPRFAFLAVLVVLVRIAVRIVRLFFEAISRGAVKLEKFDPEWAEPTYKIVRAAIVALGLIVAYPYIPGSESAAFKGVSVFLGVLFSLGSSGAVANIVAGYSMTYRRAFKIGDRVKIGEAFGDVFEIRLQATHLRSLKNEEIVIPNAQVLAGDVLNYSSLARERGLILHAEVGIGYETPWRQVEAMLLSAAAQTESVLEDPSPFVLLKRLGDFAVVYEINAYCRDVQQMALRYTQLHQNVLDVFNTYHVQIMTPAYEGDPSEPKVVAPQDWYAAPAAGVAVPVTRS